MVFKKGQSGNPGGRPKLPGDIADARKLTRIEFERLVNKYLWLDEAAFTAAMTDPACTVMEKMIGSLMAKAILEGDDKRLNFLLDRLVGKIVDKVEITLPKPFVVTKTDGTQVIAGAKLEEKS